MTTITVTTREQMSRNFADQGAHGAALDFLVAATARARHEARVQATLDAAGMPPDGQPSWCPENVPALQAAVLVADLVGVGGPRHEALGLATVRVPCFSGLGKGRRQASDGGAWMAAAEDALRRLCDSCAGSVIIEALEGTPGEGYPGAVRVSVGTAVVSLLDLPQDVLPLAWRSAVVVHGLRKVAGLPVRLVPGTWVGSVAEWSTAFNRVAVATQTDVESACAAAQAAADAAAESDDPALDAAADAASDRAADALAAAGVDQ